MVLPQAGLAVVAAEDQPDGAGALRLYRLQEPADVNTRLHLVHGAVRLLAVEGQGGGPLGDLPDQLCGAVPVQVQGHRVKPGVEHPQRPVLVEPVVVMGVVVQSGGGPQQEAGLPHHAVKGGEGGVGHEGGGISLAVVAPDEPDPALVRARKSAIDQALRRGVEPDDGVVL